MSAPRPVSTSHPELAPMPRQADATEVGDRPHADEIVRMRDVSVRRGGNTLLAEMTWSVELDERWVVIGPNGAGKTTLLRLAAAEMHATSGTVSFAPGQSGGAIVYLIR